MRQLSICSRNHHVLANGKPVTEADLVGFTRSEKDEYSFLIMRILKDNDQPQEHEEE